MAKKKARADQHFTNTISRLARHRWTICCAAALHFWKHQWKKNVFEDKNNCNTRSNCSNSISLHLGHSDNQTTRSYNLMGFRKQMLRSLHETLQPQFQQRHISFPWCAAPFVCKGDTFFSRHPRYSFQNSPIRSALIRYSLSVCVDFVSTLALNGRSSIFVSDFVRAVYRFRRRNRALHFQLSEEAWSKSGHIQSRKSLINHRLDSEVYTVFNPCFRPVKQNNTREEREIDSRNIDQESSYFHQDWNPPVCLCR